MPPEKTVASIVTKLEARLSERLVDQIRPLLAGRSAEVQRAVLAALAAELPAEQTTKEQSMVGSDHDFTWARGYIQTQHHTAIEKVDVLIGSDRIFRVNIDGVCALRVRLDGDAKLVIRDFRKLLEPSDEPSPGGL